MPGTRYSEAALRRRRERRAAVAAFPGRLPAWEAAVDRRLIAVRDTPAGSLLLFEGGQWLLACLAQPAPDDVQAALLAARDLLEPIYTDAYAELDARIAAEREAMRLARMEKILGAVETNLPEIPELRDALREELER